MPRVLVFGTFDGIHDGHRAMLRQAKGLGSYVVAAVTPDAVIEIIKGRKPHHASGARITLLKNERLADEVILGDSVLHSWKIIKKIKPDVIALGYDQAELKQSLEEYLERIYPDHSSQDDEHFQKAPKKPTIVVLSAYEPHRLHNRLLHP